MLLRGIGVLHNDVAVVTNVSEDHLGLHGVDTVDQLAEVKGIITRITRPQGWDVLNADDPRVLAMRRHATGRPWLFTADPDHPAIREALADGGRAMTVLDRRLSWLERRRHASARAARSTSRSRSPASHRRTSRTRWLPPPAALGDRAARTRRREGAEDVRPRSRTEPRTRQPVHARRADHRDRLRPQRGRDGRPDRGPATGLRRKGRDVWLTICTAGDRTDEILHAFAFRGGGGADHVVRRRARCTTCEAAPARTSSSGCAKAPARPGSTTCPSTPTSSPRCGPCWPRPGRATWSASPRSGCARRSSRGWSERAPSGSAHRTSAASCAARGRPKSRVPWPRRLSYRAAAHRTQSAAHGIASSRSGGISAPQRSQTP